MTAPHPDDFSLLVLLEGEMSELEAARLRRHLAGCPACAAAYREIEKLDQTLKSTLPGLEAALAEPELPEGDTFRCRPDCVRLDRPRPGGEEAMREIFAASREAAEVKSRLLNAAAAPEEDLREALADLDLLALRDRYGLGYALDDALYNMVEGPARWARFGRASTDRVLEARSDGRAFDAPAERAYPLDDLLGLSLLVDGNACLWSGEFPRAGRVLRRSYAAFARGSTSERRLASVELFEGQRRAFLDRATEALHLIERARLSFKALGLEDEAAKAGNAHAVALSYLSRDEEAIDELREILPVLARYERWNAYVAALNGLGTCLLNLGRIDEARREYARALRLVGRDARPAVHAFVRANLARTLFEGKRYSEAARASDEAARHYSAQGSKVDELTMRLLRVEALARSGESVRALEALSRLSEEVAALGAADPEILASLEAALGGDLPDVDLVETLRSRAQEQISERLRQAV
ncbi:MAG: zf-HC2 domain-containing protein [Holophagales bacterium]|nr:zf-HC2 domain-containing protein [Holophagales bacterium]